MREVTSQYKREQEHKERLRLKGERLEGLKALQETHREKGNRAEVIRLAAKIRLCRQELRYMTDGADYFNDLDFKIVGRKHNKPKKATHEKRRTSG